jgi:CRISPR-associated protein Cmr1
MKLGGVDHPEKGKIDPLLYLAGMGIMEKGKPKHHFFPPKSEFQLAIDFPVSHERDIESVLALLQCFGSIGARRRNGWGSFQIISGGIDSSRAAELLKKHTFIWTEGLDNDYPNCLGRDEKGLLLWQTKIEHSWWDAMIKMAEAYIQIRAGEVAGIGKLDPGQKTASERHLLGVPLTNHPVPAWGQSARHASPLHFTVHRKKEDYRGLILHLPFAYSKEMPFSKEIKQDEVWKKVHKKLDDLLTKRAQYEDCL